MAKAIIKKTISDPQLKTELFKLFEAGNTDNTNIYEQIRTRFKIAKERHVKFYHSTLAEWQQMKDKATNEQVQANQSEVLKSGLKSKIEWVSILQKELDDNQVEESVLDLKTGKVIRYMRKMTPTERKGHMERISKFMGYDSPTKVASTDPDGNPATNPLEKLIEAGGKIVING